MNDVINLDPEDGSSGKKTQLRITSSYFLIRLQSRFRTTKSNAVPSELILDNYSVSFLCKLQHVHN